MACEWWTFCGIFLTSFLACGMADSCCLLAPCASCFTAHTLKKSAMNYHTLIYSVLRKEVWLKTNYIYIINDTAYFHRYNHHPDTPHQGRLYSASVLVEAELST